MLNMAVKNDHSIKSRYPWLKEYYPVYTENGKVIVHNGEVGKGFAKRADADKEGLRLQEEANKRMQELKDKVMAEYMKAHEEAIANKPVDGQVQNTDD